MEAFAHNFTQAILFTVVLYVFMWTIQKSFQIKIEEKSTAKLITTFILLFITSIGFLMMMEIKLITSKPVGKNNTQMTSNSDIKPFPSQSEPAKPIPAPAPLPGSTPPDLDVQLVRPDQIPVTFDSIIGLDETKKELKGILKLLKSGQHDLPLPNGILLYGPPGTGKTLMARAFAKESNLKILSISGADFEDKYVGEGAKRIRKLFSFARKHTPCIIFIDEIDALAPSRSIELGKHNVQTVNMLLAELDNFDSDRNHGIIFMAATNHIEVLDPALLRPGRFDKKILLSLPEKPDRFTLLNKFALKNGFNDKEYIDYLAENTKGYSPAQLENIIDNAVIKANIEGRKSIQKSDISKSFENSEQEMVNFVKSSRDLDMDILRPNQVKARFDDIAGYNEIKDDLKQTIDFLQNPKKYKEMGAVLPKGIMFFGPPGTGKTLFARAIAGESNVTFISTNGSSFVQSLVGVGAQRVRELFQTARSLSPCIIFIDEIDTLLRNRNADAGEYSQTTNEFLAQMDNIMEDANQGIILIGATNRLDMLDEAAIRPGRFDKKLYVRLPNLVERQEIIKHYLSKVKASKNIKPLDVASGTGGFAGADIKNLINLSALRAVQMKRTEISIEDIEYAKDNIVLGKEVQSTDVLQEERYNTAIHEAGHTIVGILSKHYPLEFYKVTIGLRNSTLGVTHFQEITERHGYTKEMYIDIIATMMGGRIAEEITFGPNKITSGASSDLKQSTNIASAMIEEYALGDNEDMIAYRYLSAPPQDKINTQIKAILDEGRKRAYSILKNKEKALKKIAEQLLIKETLTVQEVKKIIAEN